jgi:hypothetical protein
LFFGLLPAANGRLAGGHVKDLEGKEEEEEKERKQQKFHF